MKSVLCCEWLGRSMRYQLDRKFFNISPKGAIKTLELTEVTLEDSKEYPALFPEPPEILK